MLIARAPVRISLAGGGTDLPAYYSRHGGLVINAAIDRYFYAIIGVAEGRDIQVTSSDYRTFYRHDRRTSFLWEGDLSLPLAILHEFGFSSGLSVFLASEVPPGTGLGSSSAVAVALVKALATLRDRALGKLEVAELACRIEIEKLGMPIGKQDQYASSFGGINAFRFERDGTVRREPLRLSPEALEKLQTHLMLCFTGSARNSSTILRGQRSSSEAGEASVVGALHRIRGLAEETRQLLEAGDLDAFGALLHESWQQKKRLAKGISNPEIDRCYDLAIASGASGGKIAGAGGGGFLMLCCRPERQAAVAQALQNEGLRQMDFRIDFGGARVLVHSARSLPLPDDSGLERG